MLASLDDVSLVDARWVYEPKYDGIRGLAAVARRDGGGVRIWSRRGNDKTAQFPEIVHALARLAERLPSPVVLDGEIVALDPAGEPAGFQRLQARIHRAHHPHPGASGRTQPVGFVVFDVVGEGADDLTGEPLRTRRARLERILAKADSPLLRLSEFVRGDGRELQRRAAAHGREGLIAKRLDSPYQPGRRSADWRKLKIQATQSCVVGGWTEPRGTRAHLGALLLGVWEEGRLRYVGHTGPGFTGAELTKVAARLGAIETATCPFTPRPATNERPHWVEPRLVAEVRFTEWTDDGRLRHPTYLGLRDDVDPRAVRRELAQRVPETATAVTKAPTPSTVRGRRREPDRVQPDPSGVPPQLQHACRQLAELERERGGGRVNLPGGALLETSNLGKVLWPATGMTKGELMRYYITVSPYLLPAVADRPLIMRRHPNGVTAKAFYQQRAPARTPPGVRVETIAADKTVPSRLVGGSLVTLLYMAQLAVISQDPWFSRQGSLDFPDHAVIDLDPMPGVAFAAVLDVARRVHDELERLSIPSVPKTSGADGLHVYVPLAPRTPWDAARLFAQIVATLVAQKHPRVATVEREVRARGRTVYVDYLQNVRGKSVATAYSARASDIGGASAPLTWDEVHAGVDRRDFTLRTLPSRLAAVGDLWAPIRTGPNVDLTAVLDRLGA
jgi:bifunctional non-homologous end joining protein LigD